jgi:hypothetical protein
MSSYIKALPSPVMVVVESFETLMLSVFLYLLEAMLTARFFSSTIVGVLELWDQRR